jgi:7-cyano-7-deazaguanine synthase
MNPTTLSRAKLMTEEIPPRGGAVVLLSGGQDSVTTLLWTLQRHRPNHIVAISADYGQRHKVELQVAEEVAHDLGVWWEPLDLSVLGRTVHSNLIGNSGEDFGVPHPEMPEVPNSFVPARNAMLLTLAHAVALRESAGYVYAGMCQTDYSGYPDCREAFISALENTLNIGYLADVKFIAPLMHLTKAETFALADYCGGLELVICESHTCYQGDRTHRHEWGFGCGECPACQLRAKGWSEYQTMIKEGLA